MFSRRQLAVLALLACYAVPAFAGRGLHGAERCACLPREAQTHAGHRHGPCSHDHARPAPFDGAARVEHAEPPHGLTAHQDCDLCSYLAQAQCALDPAADLRCSEPVAPAPAALVGQPAAPVVGGYSPRGPPAFAA
ncbi:MAG: hypothetical protein U0836_12390 [Pirellulales bacterium]